MNQTPEQQARDRIDAKLRAAGWVVQDKDRVDLYANTGVAVREFQTAEGPADYVLFVKQTPVDVIEAKREERGIIVTVEEILKSACGATDAREQINEVTPNILFTKQLIATFALCTTGEKFCWLYWNKWAAS